MESDAKTTTVAAADEDAEMVDSATAVEAVVHQLRKHGPPDNGTEDMQSDSPPKKKKRKSSGGDVSKNALQILNEMKPGLEYNGISQSGPSHQPSFTVQVTVNDEVCHLLYSNYSV